MSVFKKYYSPSPAAFRRSLSEQDADTTKAMAILKNYQWYHQIKSKRTCEQEASEQRKPLGACRWQTPPKFNWKVSRKELSHNLKWENNEQSPVEDPLQMDSTSADDLQEDPTGKPIKAGIKPFRVPFNRSISEPEPHWRNRSSKTFLHPAHSIDCEQQGYFIRGIFSTLSSGFSKMLNRKEELNSEAGNECRTDGDQSDLNTGKYTDFCFAISVFG